MELKKENEKMQKNKVLFSVEKMPNTELRYRFKIDEDTIYSITKSGDKLQWQNSHFHKLCNEVYVVQSGKILMVTKIDDKISKKIAKEGEVILIKKNVAHNLFLDKGTEICVLKYGKIEGDDWYSDKKLDEMCGNIDMKNFFH